MATYKLILSIQIDTETEAEAVAVATEQLVALNEHLNPNTLATLTRHGDRSGANLLLDKLDGRCGQHYQTKKAPLNNIIGRIK